MALAFASLFNLIVFLCKWCTYEFVIAILFINFTVNICKMYSHPLFVCFVGFVQIDVQLLSMISHLWVEDSLRAFFFHFYLSLLVGFHLSWSITLGTCALFVLEFIFVIWWFNILFDDYKDYLFWSLKIFLLSAWFMWNNILNNTIFHFILWVGV